MQVVKSDIRCLGWEDGVEALRNKSHFGLVQQRWEGLEEKEVWRESAIVGLDVLSWRCQLDTLEMSRSSWRHESGAQNSREKFRALCSEMGLKPTRLGKVTETEFKWRTESPRLVLSTLLFTVWWWRHSGTKKKRTREKPAAQMVNQGKHCFLWVWDDTFLC